MRELPILLNSEMVRAIIEGRKTQTRHVYKNVPSSVDLYAIQKHSKAYVLSKSPYGDIGDLLYVRESYCPGYFDDGANGYKADWNSVAAEYCTEPKWTPSIDMPKKDARIWLKNIHVYVQRLNDLFLEDAIAEGIKPVKSSLGNGWINYSREDDSPYFFNPIWSFASLWDSIYGLNSWSENPWVWVNKFEVLSINGKP